MHEVPTKGAWQRGRLRLPVKQSPTRTRWFAQRAALDAARAAGRRPSAANNPSAPTSHTGLAQLAERRPPTPKVRGSIPWPGASASRRSQVVEGGGLQSRRRKPASVRSGRLDGQDVAQQRAEGRAQRAIGSSSPGLVSSADRAAGFYPAGRPFESVTRRQFTSPIAQMAERLAVNQEVRGSKPRRGAGSV